MVRRLAACAAALAVLAFAPAARAQCVGCHEKLQPGIVSDWSISKHARAGVSCEACHGTGHTSDGDVSGASFPGPDTCASCHPTQVSQFKRGKHARAWAAVKALPTFHHLDKGDALSPTGCASCHRVGLKTAAEAAELREAGATRGMASCDACHTRHLFSVAEARQPEACRACHGDLQYQAWSESKHGTRHFLAATGRIEGGAAAPTCQGCHMQKGDHAVRTPWGNLALRLPLPRDPQWAKDRALIFEALGVLDAKGEPGPRMAAFEEAVISHMDLVGYQNERLELTTACRNCHGAAFVRETLDARDGLVREADRVGAAAIREVTALRKAGLVGHAGKSAVPDLVAAAAGTPIERRLAALFFETRPKLVATAFHMSPGHVEWQARMRADLAEIKRLAAELRRAGKRSRK